MADLVTIGTSKFIEVIKARLEQEFNLLCCDGMEITCQEQKVGDTVFLGYDIANAGDTGYSREDIEVIIRHYLAEVISDVILEYWEEELVRQLLTSNHDYLTPEERSQVFQLALKYLRYDNGDGEQSTYFSLGRKSRILHRLLDFLKQNNKVIIEGFIRFRLKDYLRELENAVLRALDEIMLEREYREFIRLLRYFVEIQEPRLEKVHVVMRPSGTFKLFDDRARNISSEYLDNLLVEIGECEISYEDLLMSALITIAPTRIILHFGQGTASSTTIETVKQVFGERVSSCPGCSLCHSILN